MAVNVSRSWNATQFGSRKKTGSSAAVAPPDTVVDLRYPHQYGDQADHWHHPQIAGTRIGYAAK
jgi:hypothetical protein